jgi:hypothetical protein
VPYADPVLRKEKHRSWRENNAFHLAEKREERRDLKKAVVTSRKENPCYDCGLSFCKEAMTFDHRPGETKSFEISRYVGHPTSKVGPLILELNKCDLVCVGCHRDRSHSRLPEYVISCPKHRSIGRVKGCTPCTHYYSLAKLRTSRLALVRDHKSRPCADCKQSFDPWKMDLDHLSDKSDNVSNLVGSQASLSRILAELEKCEVVCCWCHVLRTISRRPSDDEAERTNAT